MSLRFLPNALTLLRIALVAPMVWLLVRGEYALTCLVFAVAAVTDAADGLLAKQFGWTSALGKFLDPLADKLLLVVAFVTLSLIGLVPAWLAVLVVGRDVVIGAGAAAYRHLYGPLEGQPTPVSKLNTLCQILYVFAVIVAAAGVAVPAAAVLVLGAVVAVTTCVSGLDYVLRYVAKAAAVRRLRAGS